MQNNLTITDIKIYKQAEDSFTRPIDEMRIRKGIDVLKFMTKQGIRRFSRPSIDLIYYISFKARRAGYDYIIFDKSKTVSGRYEALKITPRLINNGKDLAANEYEPPVRMPNIKQSFYCIGDVYIPGEDLPKKIDQLPELNIAKEQIAIPKQPEISKPQPDIEYTVEDDLIVGWVKSQLESDQKFSANIMSATMRIAARILVQAAQRMENGQIEVPK